MRRQTQTYMVVFLIRAILVPRAAILLASATDRELAFVLQFCSPYAHAKMLFTGLFLAIRQ